MLTDAAPVADTPLITSDIAPGGRAPAVLPGTSLQTATERSVADKLLSQLEAAAVSLVTLQVVTVVAPIDLKHSSDEWARWEARPQAGSDVAGAVTQLDLVGGDIRTAVSAEFAGAAFADMLAHHHGQVAEGRKIVADNLRAMQELARSLHAMMTERRG